MVTMQLAVSQTLLLTVPAAKKAKVQEHSINNQLDKCGLGWLIHT